MEGHAQKCVERHCEFAHKTGDIHHKVSTPCFDDHQVKSRRSGRGERIVREWISDCMVMLVFGKIWRTKFTSDSQLLGQINHKVEPSVRFTTGTS